MQIIIHRGTHEIGGSCVEIIGKENRILIDIGMPIVDKHGGKFNFRDYQAIAGHELVNKGVLPDVKGFYSWDSKNKLIDGLLVSHPHQDHYGFINYIDSTVPVYLGKAAKKLIDLTVFYTPAEGKIGNPQYIESGHPFQVGEFNITPYLMDHSAFDSYAFLIQGEGKSVLYSGDFREHGRKSKAFYWFLHNTPDKVDALLLEGTSFGRDNNGCMTEADIEEEMVKISNETQGIVLVHQSSQNIDRLVSFYRASLKSNRIFVVDIYTAHIMRELKAFAKIPFPSEQFPNVRVFYPWRLSNKIANEGYKDKLLTFSSYKITREEIASNPSNMLMLVRPTMLSDLHKIDSFDNASYVYSLWEGYLKEDNLQGILKYIKEMNMEFIKLHTSGHASIDTLKKVIMSLNPDMVIPIHTFYPEGYKNLCNKVLDVADGEVIYI